MRSLYLIWLKVLSRNETFPHVSHGSTLSDIYQHNHRCLSLSFYTLTQPSTFQKQTRQYPVGFSQEVAQRRYPCRLETEVPRSWAGLVAQLGTAAVPIIANVKTPDQIIAARNGEK